MTQLLQSLDKLNECGFQFDNSYLTLPESFYTRLTPSPVKAPNLVVLNNELAMSMGLHFLGLGDADKAALFSGNIMPQGSQPFAQAYAGHQFGHFTMLGDGRALVWGEHILPDGKRVDIQFKGSGRTPYSRGGDGRSTLGPMLREYIISEAMHGLGIPTTRSLAVVSTGEEVARDTMLPGSILTRVATSHIRVGTFEYAVAKGGKQLLETLLTYVMERHFAHIKHEPNTALAFLQAMVDRQSDLIVNWMRVGFIHGVMNTDNMTISGETIDYGPCAFMDIYDPDTVFSSIDHMGRYAYANQPVIAQWNLARLAETTLSLLDQDENKALDMANEVIGSFERIYTAKWTHMMKSKLGLFGTQPGDEQLIADLLTWMKNERADYTNTFWELTQSEKSSGKLYDSDEFSVWHEKWHARLDKNEENLTDSLQLMSQTNPCIIPRNHNVEAALDAAIEGDLTPFNMLLSALKHPYQESSSLKSYQTPPTPSERVHHTFCGT